MRPVTRDKLRPPSEHKSPFRSFLQHRKAIFLVVKCLLWIRLTLEVFLFAAPMAAKWPWALFFFITSLLGWDGSVSLYCCLRLFKGHSLNVHLSLHLRTSFLPFTVDGIGAISRAHRKLSSLCKWPKVEKLKQMFSVGEGLKLWKEKRKMIGDWVTEGLKLLWGLYSSGIRKQKN